MKKFLDQSSWRTALGNLLPSAHGHQGGSRKAAIGSMLIMAFAFVGCDDSSSASAGPNDEPGVESSSSSSGKVTEPDEVTSSSSEKAKSSSSDPRSEVKQSSSSEKSGKSSSSGEKETSSSSLKSESSSSDENSQSSSSEVVVNSSSSVSVLSSSSLNGFDWSLPKEAYFNPDIDYGEVTDERDGKVYRTVKIGEQTWMAENLNYAYTGVPYKVIGSYVYTSDSTSWCYENDPANCTKYGRLYTWAAAIDSVKLANDVDNPQDCGYGRECGLTGKVQGICPSGWHLPSYDEWNALFTAVGGQLNPGKVLKSQTGWNNNGNGTDAYGFSALPAGYRPYDGYFYGGGINAFFWSATEYGSYNAFYIYLYYYNEYANLLSYDKYYGFSVRCVKD